MKRMLSKLNLRFAIVIAGALLATGAQASEGAELKNFREDYGNVASMQRGARDYMAYCSGCHSLKYLRYQRMAQDLDIPEDLLKANLMFGTDKVGEPIKGAMPAASEQWFGREPPDLSLEARARGVDWIYTYLQSFYLDPTRPTGVNNTVLPGASMPDVLWELQGWQRKAEAAPKSEAGHGGFESVSQGSMTPEEYREFVGDLTNFMAYAAEPGKRARIHLGFAVIGYLLLLLVLTYLLKKEFWRDVH